MTKQEFLLLVLHEGFDSRSVGFTEKENVPKFLFLNRRFKSTSDIYHVMVTQTRPAIDLIHWGGLVVRNKFKMFSCLVGCVTI